MRFAFANVLTMPPATRAFLVRRLRDRRARLFRLFDGEITQNEKFLQLFFAKFARHIGIRTQNNRRLQRIADQFFLTRLLNRLTDHAT